MNRFGRYQCAIFVGLVALAACVGEEADNYFCTAGATSTCVGEGACTGAQTCNSDGRSYGPCQCANVPGPDGDGGAGVDAGSTPSVVPTSGGLEITLVLVGASSAPTTCSEHTAIKNFFVTLKPAAGDGTAKSVPCTVGRADFLGFAFGSYTVAAEVIDDGLKSHGKAPPQAIELSPSSCDALNGTICVKNVTLTVRLND